MAFLTPPPSRQQPFVDENGALTVRAGEWVTLVNLAPPIQGTGSPESVVEARIGQWFIDTAVTAASGFLYLKQFADISGNRKAGWKIIHSGALKVPEVTDDYTAVPSDSGVSATGTFNVTLFAKDDAEQFITIKSISPGGTITVIPDGTETIEGASTHALTPGQSVTLMPITAGWAIV